MISHKFMNHDTFILYIFSFLGTYNIHYIYIYMFFVCIFFFRYLNSTLPLFATQSVNRLWNERDSKMFQCHCCCYIFSISKTLKLSKLPVQRLREHNLFVKYLSSKWFWFYAIFFCYFFILREGRVLHYNTNRAWKLFVLYFQKITSEIILFPFFFCFRK